jgi:hypothetical protein
MFRNANTICGLRALYYGNRPAVVRGRECNGDYGPIQQWVARVLPFLDTCDREFGVFRRVTV